MANDCLKVIIDDYTKPQLVPKLLLHFSVREFHNNLISATKYGGLKEAWDEDDNIIISDSILYSLLPPQFKNIVKIQVHVWLLMLHICQKYAFIISIMALLLFKKTQGYQPKWSKQKVWVKIKSHVWHL